MSRPAIVRERRARSPMRSACIPGLTRSSRSGISEPPSGVADAPVQRVLPDPTRQATPVHGAAAALPPSSGGDGLPAAIRDDVMSFSLWQLLSLAEKDGTDGRHRLLGGDVESGWRSADGRPPPGRDRHALLERHAGSLG